MAVGGILLPAHDAVLDGFLNHLQGPKKLENFIIFVNSTHRCADNQIIDLNCIRWIGVFL